MTGVNGWGSRGLGSLVSYNTLAGRTCSISAGHSNFRRRAGYALKWRVAVVVKGGVVGRWGGGTHLDAGYGGSRFSAGNEGPPHCRNLERGLKGEMGGRHYFQSQKSCRLEPRLQRGAG